MTRRIRYVDVDWALARLLRSARLQPRIETVSFAEAYGRIVAADIRTPKGIPPHNTSHVDGYAVRAADTRGASNSKPVALRLAGRIGPGEYVSKPISSGEAVRILTGGHLPPGADAVVPQEEAKVEGSTVRRAQPVSRWAFVISAGEDVPANTLLLRRGARVRAQDVDLLAMAGVYSLPVYARPRAAIVSVGSELTLDTVQTGRGRILASHAYLVARIAEASGCVVRIFPPLPDNSERIVEGLRVCQEGADVLFTIGGSSVSEIDLVEEALVQLGPPGIIAHGLKLQPARVAGCGVAGELPFILLPGLVQSTVNALIFLGLPVIHVLQGLPPRRDVGVVRAEVAQDVELSQFLNFRKVVWVRVLQKNGQTYARPYMADSSMVSVLTKADGYVVVPEGKTRLRKRQRLDVHLVPGISRLDFLP